jgi:hypothetical protein
MLKAIGAFGEHTNLKGIILSFYRVKAKSSCNKYQWPFKKAKTILHLSKEKAPPEQIH